MLTQRTWSIVSALCLIVAAVFTWRSHLDGAFVAATLGVVAWFLGLRDRLRKTIIAESDTPDAESNDSGDQDED